MLRAHMTGIVTSGHPETTKAAELVLREGGNAFDAVIAAVYTACVAEPVLASLGGGGFVLARPASDRARVYDFFTHTPRRRRPLADIEFYPVHVDFGSAVQEFHIGMGSIATPGVVRGICRLHADLARLPLASLASPAIELAAKGVKTNALQAYVSTLVEPILRATPASRSIFCKADGTLPAESDRVSYPALADALDCLAREGERLFYEGEMAHSIVRDCERAGGFLRRDDLAEYRVEVREPLQFDFHRARLLTNPGPSHGGALIGLALKLLESRRLAPEGFGSPVHLKLLADVMGATDAARLEQDPVLTRGETGPHRLLDTSLIEHYHARIARRPRAQRGTTQITIIDRWANIASATLSNGEGSSYVIPHTGVMLNNMLGEEDINPGGFHRWPLDARMSSMMAPTIAFIGKRRAIATGSGGSNRIRSAIVQVLLNLIDFELSVEEAVTAPRIHYERGLLNIEPGYAQDSVRSLCEWFPEHSLWREKNMFFGGAHTAVYEAQTQSFSGAGDPRRGGTCTIIGS